KYGGEPAPRLMLHAHRIGLEEGTFEASVPAVFDDVDALVAAREYRQLLFDENTNAYRLINGAADGFRAVVVDWYDGRALVQWQTERRSGELVSALPAKAVYEQFVTKQKRTKLPVIERFPIRENGLTFLVGFGEGLS